jgi:hypothetical protein
MGAGGQKGHFPGLSTGNPQFLDKYSILHSQGYKQTPLTPSPLSVSDLKLGRIRR